MGGEERTRGDRGEREGRKRGATLKDRSGKGIGVKNEGRIVPRMLGIDAPGGGRRKGTSKYVDPLTDAVPD